MNVADDGSFSWAPVSPVPRRARRFQFSATLYRADGTVVDLLPNDPVPETVAGDRMVMSFRPYPQPLWPEPRTVAAAIVVVLTLALVALVVWRPN